MLGLLETIERIKMEALMLMMALVPGLATIDLAWILTRDTVKPPTLVLRVDQLLELLGAFMLVVIGIDLPETIMNTCLTQGQPHHEVVLSVAIIAIAPKAITLDLDDRFLVSLTGLESIFAREQCFSLARDRNGRLDGGGSSM